MRGLLKKELYLLFGVGWLLVLITVIFAAAAGWKTEMGNFFSTFSLCYVPLGVFNILSWEEKWRWSAFVLCAPVSRFQVVLAKYIMTVVYMVAVGAVNILAVLAFGNPIGIENLTWGLTLAFGVGTVCFPPMFYFGSDRARGVIVGIAMVVSCLLGTFANLYGEGAETSFVMNISLWVPAAAFAVFAASCPLSVWLYGKRRN